MNKKTEQANLKQLILEYNRMIKRSFNANHSVDFFDTENQIVDTMLEVFESKLNDTDFTERSQFIESSGNKNKN